MKNLMPKAWITAGVKAATDAKPKIVSTAKNHVISTSKIEARIDMSEGVAGAGLCPDCKRPMERAMANGIDTYVCHSDRISIPVPDAASAEDQPVEAVFGPSTSEPLL